MQGWNNHIGIKRAGRKRTGSLITYVCEGVDDVWECDCVQPAASQLKSPHGVVDSPEHDVDRVKTSWNRNLKNHENVQFVTEKQLLMPQTIACGIAVR